MADHLGISMRKFFMPVKDFGFELFFIMWCALNTLWRVSDKQNYGLTMNEHVNTHAIQPDFFDQVER